jgi:hypothetical protein
MRRTALALLGCMGLAVAGTSAFGLDNYTCYKAKDLKNPKFAATTRDVSDEFASQTGMTVKKPAMYCTPASINGSALEDASTILNCYQVKGTKGTDTADKTVTDGFGTLHEGIKSSKTSLLCVPGSAS